MVGASRSTRSCPKRRNIITPKEVARQLKKLIGGSDAVSQYPHGEVEMVYLIVWAIRNLWHRRDKWTADMSAALLTLYPDADENEMLEHFDAYDEATKDQSGGGPMWHMTTTFQAYASGSNTYQLDLMGNTALAAEIAAILKTVNDGLASM